MKKTKNVLKVLLSAYLVLMILVSSVNNCFIAFADDSSLILNYIQSGQISWDGYASYKFSIDSYANLSIDFDCKYTNYGARSPKIIIVTESDYNDWKIGKNVINKYYSEAQTSNDYDFWCDDVATLDAGDYRFIIDNSQGWGYYSTNYTLCVTPIVVNPVISHSDSCRTIKLNFQGDLGIHGYSIEQLIDNKYVEIKTINSSVHQIEINNLIPKNTYYFRIRGYAFVNGIKYYSEWLNLNATTNHVVEIDPNVPATCKENGLTKGSHCSICGTVLEIQQIIPKIGHNYIAVVTLPTCIETGFTTYICTYCGESYISNYVSPSGHDFGNNDKICRICGELNQNYVEKPKSTSIKKLTKGKMQIYITWKKIGGISGYQIQYSTDKKFKKNKKTITAKKSSTSAIIKKLKSKKTYYVRVRTYKTVKINGKSTKVYSSWSKVKSVKTK